MSIRKRAGLGAMVLVTLALLVLLNYFLSLLNVPDDFSVIFGVISIIVLVIFGPSVFVKLWKWTFNINKTPKVGE